MVCYICGKELTHSKGGLYIGQGKYRHYHCEVGSMNWLKYRKNSPLYELVVTALENAKKEKEVRRALYNN